MFLGLKVDSGLNVSWKNGLSSYIKCHINLSFLPYSSSFLFNFASSILFAVGTNLSPFDKREISGEERFLLEKFTKFSLTNLLSIQFPLKVATLSFSLDTFPALLDREFSALLLISFSALFCTLFSNLSCYFEKPARTHEILL